MLRGPREQQLESEEIGALATVASTGATELADWGALLTGIKQGQDWAIARLYSLFERGIRFQLARQLGSTDLDDRTQETFLAVLDALRRGEVREPDRLMGFIRTVVRRQTTAYIEEDIRRRRLTDLTETAAMPDTQIDLEADAIRQERVELMISTLDRLGPKDAEVLRRFYLDDEPVEDICASLQITETQFRLLKSRAKAKFTQLAQRRMAAAGFSARFLGRLVRQ